MHLWKHKWSIQVNAATDINASLYLIDLSNTGRHAQLQRAVLPRTAGTWEGRQGVKASIPVV